MKNIAEVDLYGSDSGNSINPKFTKRSKKHPAQRTFLWAMPGGINTNALQKICELDLVHLFSAFGAKLYARVELCPTLRAMLGGVDLLATIRAEFHLFG